MSTSSGESNQQRPRQVKIIVDARVRINREKLDLETVKALREMFTHKNPKFLQAKRMGFSTWKTPPNLNSFSLENPFLLFPRGALNRITELLEARGYEIEAVVDRSLKLERLKLELAYQLYPYQQEAVDAVVRSGNCVVRGPCGSGKTILILGAIAALKQPTLVIVHTEALKKQWSAVISDWLGFVPGSIGGGGKTIIRPITIGMQQTIWRVEKTKPAWVQQFGCIAIDECLEGNVPILMADGSLKKICDVQIDDIVAVGGRVLRLFRGTYEGPGFTINGWFVTPNHRIPTVNGTKRIDEMEEGDVVYEDPKRNERVLHLREEVEESQQERSLSETRDQIIRPVDRKVSGLWESGEARSSGLSCDIKMRDGGPVEQRRDEGDERGNVEGSQETDREEAAGGWQETAGEVGVPSDQSDVQGGVVTGAEKEVPESGGSRETEGTSEGEVQTRERDWLAIEWAKRREGWKLHRERVGNAVQASSVGVCAGIRGPDGTEVSMANLLHAGLRASGNDAGGGAGRFESRLEEGAGEGREEGRVPPVGWMEGVPLPGTVRLRRSRADVRRLDVDVTFERFNIETENGVYVAGGVLKFNCHHVASRTFQVVANMFPAAYRVGASADEKRKDGLEHMIYDTLGPCVYEIKRQELIDMNRLLPVDMLLVRTGYENEGYLSDMEEGIPPDWNKMLNELTTDEDRNEVIKQTSLRLLAEPKNRLLMLSERVQTCHEWKEVFDSHGHPCRVMVGGNKNETEQAISDLRTGKIRIAVGTKIADEGLDIPQLTHVLVTCPVHTHPKRLEQMVGRAARVWEGKTQATAIYFWDSGMFPMPSTYSDDPFKKRARKSAFFRNLQKACSTLQEWDIDTDEIFDVK